MGGMKRKIVLVASLVAGLLAALLTRVYISAKDAEVREMKESLVARYGGEMWVLCFKREVPGGTVLSKSDLQLKKVPVVGMQGQAVGEESFSDVVGRKLLYGHKAFDTLFWADVEGGNPTAGGLSADIKKQMRAVSINCAGAASVSGMVKPNDHVDVIGTFDLTDPAKASSKAKAIVTSTILQNVLVLAIGKQTAKTRAQDSAAGYATVTLEVTPREAEMLAFAEQMKGRLVLTLRNRNDKHFEKELPKVDFEKIMAEIEELNLSRQQQKLTNR